MKILDHRPLSKVDLIIFLESPLNSNITCTKSKELYELRITSMCKIQKLQFQYKKTLDHQTLH